MPTFAGIINDPLFPIRLDNQKPFHSTPTTHTELIIDFLHRAQWATEAFGNFIV